MQSIPQHMIGTMVRVKWNGTVYHGKLLVVSGNAAQVAVTLANGAERIATVTLARVLGPVL